jgi:hypothetical protein
MNYNKRNIQSFSVEKVSNGYILTHKDTLGSIYMESIDEVVKEIGACLKDELTD